MLVGGAALVGYLGIAGWGVVFSGTDGRPSYAIQSGGGRSTVGRRPGGGFFWGVGGYRGGK